MNLFPRSIATLISVALVAAAMGVGCGGKDDRPAASPDSTMSSGGMDHSQMAMDGGTMDHSMMDGGAHH